MPEKPRVVIVGAGIGGLCAAIALRRVGIDAVVLERSSELREVGAGIQLWVTGMRALQKIGLAQPVLGLASPTEVYEFRSWRGRVLIRVPVGELARRYGAPPAVNVRRGDLLKVLAEAVGPGVVHLGARCERVEQDEAGVTAHLKDGGQERGALLVAADGIDSTIRALLFPEAKPRFAGYQYLRALVQYEHPALPPGHFSFVFGRGDRIGLHNMGGGWMYLFGVLVTPPGTGDAPGGRKAELLERFKDFVAPVPEAIAAAAEPAIGRTDIRDLEPMGRWSDGRITLLGDAAHATTPNMGRGASEAVEDACALAEALGSAEALSDRGRIATAVNSYEEQRRRETSAIQRRAWKIGRLTSWSNPLACALRDRVMEHISSRALLKDIEADFARAGAAAEADGRPRT